MRKSSPNFFYKYKITSFALVMVACVLLLTAFVLWHTVQERQQSFLNHEKELSQRSVSNAAQQIQLYIEKERTIAQLVAENYAEKMHGLSSSSPNIPLGSNIWNTIHMLLPHSRNFTIANNKGKVILDDPDKLIGNGCKKDILSYAITRHPNEIFVHTNKGTTGDHIDIVVKIPETIAYWDKLLFISIGLDELIDILVKAKAKNHNLILVRKDKFKIELTDRGRNDALSSTRSLNSLNTNSFADSDVGGTRWRLYDTYPASLINRHQTNISVTASKYFFLLLLICLPLLLFILREEKKRVHAEEELKESHHQLEARVKRRTEELLSSKIELEHLAEHDLLTGLHNRTAFEKSLDQAIQSVRENAVSAALIYIDLDQFKVINDTSGHEAGDALLRQVAAALKELSLINISLARLGGDEFGLLLTGYNLEEAIDFTESCRLAIRRLNFSWKNQNYEMSASIGIVPINKKMVNKNDLLVAADTACYRAKELGRNQVIVFSPDLNNHQYQTDQMRVSLEISHALKEGRLELFCQSIEYIGKDKNTTKRYEALIRMRNRDGDLIAPDDFIPAAERYGYMPDIDGWVTEQALITLESIKETVYLNVNLSGLTLSNPDGLKRIIKVLDRHPTVTKQICFEITETSAVNNFSHARHFINTLKLRGCKFALDDYGSGVCSISYLRNLPVDVLKIDGELVKKINDEDVAFAMVESIVNMAKALRISCVAEHIENQALLASVKSMGIDYAQGYFFSKPGPFTSIVN